MQALGIHLCPHCSQMLFHEGGATPSAGKIITQSEGQEMFEDKTLTCKDCGREFIFTAGEQEFYDAKGFVNEPQRCKECRDARKSSARSEREMYVTVCASCGKDASVPFRPREDRPVYCSECFAHMKDQGQ